MAAPTIANFGGFELRRGAHCASIVAGNTVLLLKHAENWREYFEIRKQDRLTLFISNAEAIKKEFTWQYAETKRLAALLYAQKNKAVDSEAIQRCYDLIKQNTGIFSTFRGNLGLCVATLLSLSPNPQGLFDETLKVYDLLKEEKFHASDYLVIAAYQIAAQSNSANYIKAVTRARDFYNGMKARHFFITGQDDYIYAVMLGLSDLDVTMVVERVEKLHDQLKGSVWDKNSVQALAQILVLGGSDEETISRVLALKNALRAQAIKLDKSDTLPVLGIFALLPVEIDKIVTDISDAQTYLRGQKGFGSLSVSTQELLLFASSIVAGEYAQDLRNGFLTAAITTSITNIIIAQEVAIITMIAASGAVISAASSSST